MTLGVGQSAAQDGKSFITEAIQGNYAEVAMGQLAQKNGQNAELKSFGKTLVEDHSAANEKAEAAAKAVGATPPTGPSAEQKEMHDKLAGMSGEDFDRAFAKQMVEDHTKDIGKYEDAAKGGSDAVSQYAESTLPTLRRHLETAQMIADKVGAD